MHYACCARPQSRSCLLPGERLGIHIPHTSSPQEKRLHRGIDIEVPIAYTTFREFTTVDGVQRADRLGGLVHEYCVAA